jgi:hypothetical protein
MVHVCSFYSPQLISDHVLFSTQLPIPQTHIPSCKLTGSDCEDLVLLIFVRPPPSQFHHVFFQLKCIPLKVTLDVLISDNNLITEIAAILLHY